MGSHYDIRKMMTIKKKTSQLLLLIGLAVWIFSCRGMGGTQVQPASPPTFVIAWAESNGNLHTMESNDGIQWRNQTTHARSNTHFTPALAHDGVVTWLMMWKAGPAGLYYKTGVGGVPLNGGGGITWEQQPITGNLPVSISGSPALAYGDSRWVAAYRTPGGRIQIIRSDTGNLDNWSPPVDVVYPAVGGARPVTTSKDPALAYGNGRFVLARYYSGITVSVSLDGGQTWAEPASPMVGHGVAKSPVLFFSEGNFYAATYLSAGTNANYAAEKLRIYKSTDGSNWQQIGEGGYFSASLAAVNSGFGQFEDGSCKMLIVSGSPQFFGSDMEVWAGLPVAPHTCASPGVMAFTPQPQNRGVLITGQPVDRQVPPTVVFGSGR